MVNQRNITEIKHHIIKHPGTDETNFRFHMHITILSQKIFCFFQPFQDIIQLCNLFIFPFVFHLFGKSSQRAISHNICSTPNPIVRITIAIRYDIMIRKIIIAIINHHLCLCRIFPPTIIRYLM